MDLKARVEEALERLSLRLLVHTRQQLGSGSVEPQPVEVEEIGQMTRFLGQVRAAWVDLPDDAFPATGAGFGSTVLIEDLDSGVRARYTLMTGAMLDIGSDQVSLASPIGQALLGAQARDMIEVATPQRRRRLYVVAVETLHDKIADVLPPRLPAA